MLNLGTREAMSAPRNWLFKISLKSGGVACRRRKKKMYKMTVVNAKLLAKALGSSISRSLYLKLGQRYSRNLLTGVLSVCHYEVRP